MSVQLLEHFVLAGLSCRNGLHTTGGKKKGWQGAENVRYQVDVLQHCSAQKAGPPPQVAVVRVPAGQRSLAPAPRSQRGLPARERATVI